MKRGKSRLLAWCIVATVLAFPAALISILRTHPHDSYGFLGGRSAVAWGVLPTSSHSGGPATMFEIRIYTWEGDFFKVKEAAARALPAAGFTEVVLSGDDEHYSSWSHADGRFVWLETGRSLTIKEAFRDKNTLDSSWVTVVVSNDAPENWVSHVRLAFQDSDY